MLKVCLSKLRELKEKVKTRITLVRVKKLCVSKNGTTSVEHLVWVIIGLLIAIIIFGILRLYIEGRFQEIFIESVEKILNGNVVS
jgi:uncharacterized membrane protein YjfL (UPF0719 family)